MKHRLPDRRDMELEDYWGVGPKTTATLTESIGREAAKTAIEAGDVRALVDAGLQRSRATRILRHASSTAGMELLATRDARSVYKELIGLAADHAVSEEAGHRIRTLTPLVDETAIQQRLDSVERGRRTWNGLDETTREAVLSAFESYDDGGGSRRAAAETVVALQDAGVSGPAFEPVAALDADGLGDAASALAALGDGRIGSGADEELDRLRAAHESVDAMSANTDAVVEAVRSESAGDAAAFREGLVEHVTSETTVDPARVREAMAADARDATAFVAETLRSLRQRLSEALETRQQAVRSELEAAIESVEADLGAATSAVVEVATELSLGRFAAAYDLRRPSYTDGDGIAVREARNLSLLAADQAVQPVSYALGEHSLDGGGPGLPSGQQVSVLTGANSGGKTTLLETLCQLQILAHMGLPVPAAEAAVSLCDRLVFHRRHASFNAGVLESTLQSVVPPLVSGDRTLMLVDEFEAITEPGRAADLLNGLVQLTVEEGALGAFVTHLADDLEPLPAAARTDGIFARGLTDELELEVDYQPRFGEVGRSTPEFIVSRLVADADDRREEAGFRTLAESVDTDVIQRTLADTAWESTS
jgi:DNA mismatch repair protein MutS2